MPSFNTYKKMFEGTGGQIRKDQSDKIMNASWWEDIQSRVVYIYDYYHDDFITQLNNLDPEKDSKKTPIDAKFIQSSSQTYDKDAVTFHLQLRPDQQCNVDYYNDFFKLRYDTIFPVGLFCDIPDEQGIYNRWLIVDKANYNVTQFPTFEILRCDKVFQYIIDGKKMQIPGVLRSQNSYNSGIWTDNVITSIEDQQKFTVPLNRDTEKLYYNQRMIIDGAVLTEPRAWHITKINRIAPNGIARITLAQDFFDQHKDYIELDDNGNVIGMWADYYSSSIKPEDPNINIPASNIYSKISYAGLKPEIKVSGSYKKFTVDFFNNDIPAPFEAGTWTFTVDGAPAPVTTSVVGLDPNQIKVKFDGNSSYIGKILKINYLSVSGVSSDLEVSIIAL